MSSERGRAQHRCHRNVTRGRTRVGEEARGLVRRAKYKWPVTRRMWTEEGGKVSSVKWTPATATLNPTSRLCQRQGALFGAALRNPSYSDGHPVQDNPHH
ncbi:hypothetical protein chiPu_0013251 [Chiloscyllium punctatum]|uniref:Uncharacterized protein n=1 Tax=Chiloscyllium punctatum TaxID=137246 RepID=A0A401SWL3_CHIPU|nr:hypothetical protein [Chiloscyllium punctatum]